MHLERVLVVPRRAVHPFFCHQRTQDHLVRFQSRLLGCLCCFGHTHQSRDHWSRSAYFFADESRPLVAALFVASRPLVVALDRSLIASSAALVTSIFCGCKTAKAFSSPTCDTVTRSIFR